MTLCLARAIALTVIIWAAAVGTYVGGPYRPEITQWVAAVAGSILALTFIATYQVTTMVATFEAARKRHLVAASATRIGRRSPHRSP